MSHGNAYGKVGGIYNQDGNIIIESLVQTGPNTLYENKNPHIKYPEKIKISNYDIDETFVNNSCIFGKHFHLHYGHQLINVICSLHYLFDPKFENHVKIFNVSEKILLFL